MTDIRKFAQEGPGDDRAHHLSEDARRVLKIEGLEVEIQQRLEALKQSYRNSQRHKLIPPIVKGDWLSDASLLEEDEDIDLGGAAAQVSIANKKSKIGVVFGSDPKKSFGSKTGISDPIILGKIFGLTHGAEYRTRIQAAWANRLQDFYANLLKGTENQAVFEEAYASQFAEIVDLLNNAIDRVEDSIENAQEKRRRVRSIKGATLLALIPDELKKRFIMDITNAYLQVEQKNCSGSILATFVVPEDPFPYLWQAPSGANVVPRQQASNLSDVFDFDRELALEWDSENTREKYFPDGLWEPDKDDNGEVITVEKEMLGVNPETGETEMQTVDLPVYSMRKNPEYQKQMGSLDDRLDNYSNYAQLNFGERAIQKEASTLSKTDQYRYYIQLIKKNYGSLTKKADKGMALDFGGFLAYVMFMRKPMLKGYADQLVEAFKGANEAKKAKDTNLQKQKMAELSNIATRYFFTNDVTQRDALELAFVFTKGQNIPDVDKIVDGNYPRSVYDPNVYNNNTLPSTSPNVSMEWENPETGETVNVRAPTRKNPFYTPKLWPSNFKRADVGWPDAGMRSLHSRGFLKSRWRKVPWSTLTLEQKRDNLARMKEESDKLKAQGEDVERKKLMFDIKIIEQALFMDELRAYIKMNIAFNIDDPDAPSVVSKVEKAPPLFYYERDGDTYSVDIGDLVDKSRLDLIRETFGVSEDTPIDAATDKESNFGLLHKQPQFVQDLMSKQLTASALINRLRRLGRPEIVRAQQSSEELYFDLDGNMYNSKQELEQALIAKGSVFTLDEKVEVANLLREMVGQAIAGDEEILYLIEEIQKTLGEPQSQEEEVPEEPPEPPEQRLEIPGETDEHQLPPIRFPEQQGEPMPIAASLQQSSLRGFTKRV